MRDGGDEGRSLHLNVEDAWMCICVFIAKYGCILLCSGLKLVRTKSGCDLGYQHMDGKYDFSFALHRIVDMFFVLCVG